MLIVWVLVCVFETIVDDETEVEVRVELVDFVLLDVIVVAVVVGVQFLKVNHSVCAGRQEEGGVSFMTREFKSSQ